MQGSSQLNPFGLCNVRCTCRRLLGQNMLLHRILGNLPFPSSFFSHRRRSREGAKLLIRPPVLYELMSALDLTLLQVCTVFVCLYHSPPYTQTSLKKNV